MLDRLPVLLDPRNFAEKGRRLVGAVEISNFLRLSTELVDNSGLVDITLSFEKEGSLSVIHGEIKANLILECQACLDQVALPIDKQFKLGVVGSIEQADKLSGDCEPLILESEKISLNELIEDELLLALPDFPRHKYDCQKKTKVLTTPIVENEQSKSNNPFSVLAELKNTGD